MFYKSIIVKSTINILKYFNFLYENSLIHQVFFAIAEYIKKLTHGSVVVSNLKSKKTVMYNSIFFKIFLYIVGLIGKIFGHLVKFTQKSRERSIVMKATENSTGNLYSLLKSASIITTTMGVVMRIIGYKIGIALVVFGLVLYYSCNTIMLAIDSSLSIKYAKTLGTLIELDKEGTNGM